MPTMRPSLALTCLLALPVVGSAQQPTARTTTVNRTMEGRVVDVLGEPIPAASVRVVVENRTVARTATDGEGIYHIANVPAGGGDLHIDAPGKAAVRLLWRGPTTSRVRHAVLEDAARVRGRLVDSEGCAAANAVVIIVAGGDSQRTRTDARGDFEIAAVPLRRVFVHAFDDHAQISRSLRLVGDTQCDLQLPASRFSRRTVRIDGLPAAAIKGAIVQVTGPNQALLPNRGLEPLGADGTVRLLLDEWSLVEPVAPGFVTDPVGRLAIGGGHALDFNATPKAADENSVELTGRMRTTKNKVVSNQRLVVRDRSMRDLGSTEVDASGNFRVRVELPPDRLCQIGLPLDGWELVGDERKLRDGFTWVSILNSQKPVELWVQPTGQLSCPVRTANGTLLTLAKVVVADPEFPHRALLETTCDRAGNFRVSLPWEQYEVLAFTHDGHVCSGSVQITPGQAEAVVKWRTIETGSVTGTVLDAAGAPLPGVQLFFATEEIQNNNAVRASERQRVRVRTDRLGRYRCRGLPAGNWTVVALDEDGVAPTTLKIDANRKLRVDLVRKDPVRKDLVRKPD